MYSRPSPDPTRRDMVIIYAGEDQIVREMYPIAWDWRRAIEALEGQGLKVIWSGFLEDAGNWGKAAVRRWEASHA
jgi:hypothetical protein